jgi:predicted metal-binding protein
MHHTNSLKNIKKNKPIFNLILQQLNRKQIPVCRSCHNKITNGTYNGKALSELFNESLAAL